MADGAAALAAGRALLVEMWVRLRLMKTAEWGTRAKRARRPPLLLRLSFFLEL